MNIASILARKGGKVATCRPEQSIRQALALLVEHNIGALVVSGRDERSRNRSIHAPRHEIAQSTANWIALGPHD
jgi:CBS domain-containing protein